MAGWNMDKYPNQKLPIHDQSDLYYSKEMAP